MHVLMQQLLTKKTKNKKTAFHKYISYKLKYNTK